MVILLKLCNFCPTVPDMSTTAFIEPLPVIEFVAKLLGKDVYSRPLSDADRVKVSKNWLKWWIMDNTFGIWGQFHVCAQYSAGEESS